MKQFASACCSPSANPHSTIRTPQWEEGALLANFMIVSIRSAAGHNFDYLQPVVRIQFAL